MFEYLQVFKSIGKRAGQPQLRALSVALRVFHFSQIEIMTNFQVAFSIIFIKRPFSTQQSIIPHSVKRGPF